MSYYVIEFLNFFDVTAHIDPHAGFLDEQKGNYEWIFDQGKGDHANKLSTCLRV